MRRYCVITCGFASITLVSALCFAQTPTPKWSDLDQAVGKEDYATSKQVADVIIQRGTNEDRKKASLVYGRILLALGQKDAARLYLTQMAKPGNDPTGGQQTKIYRAWLLALDGKSDEAVKSLEKMLEGNAHGDTTAEATDVLAMFYMADGETEKAKKVVNFGLQVLQYKGVKDGYILALLRGRLTSNFTAGWAKRMYDEAEKLRAEKKFAEAGQLFAQVRAMYPKSEWAHASGFRIGQCFLGLNQSAKAVDWWQKFIKESSAGPWRGQSYVALIDAVLESELNLKKATEFAMTATATLSKGLGKDAEPSWKDAAYDIHLRLGIISLVDGRFDAATKAFEQAKQSAPTGTSSEVQSGLDRLVEASKQRAKLVPDELGVGDDRAKVAMGIGNVYNVLRQYDVARTYFTSVLVGPMRSRSAAHRSFAGLGFGRTLTTDGKTGRDKSEVRKPTNSSPLPSLIAVYEASLKEFSSGSWHDETLYRLATIIQDQADLEFGKPSNLDTCKNGKQADQPARSLSPKEIAAQAKAEKERLAALLKAKGEALPYWQRILERYPNSPRCEQAFYYAGVLLYDMAKAASADKSEQLSKDADSLFNRLCERYPKSIYVGDSCVRQIDFSLERKYDLNLATSLVDQGLQWAKSRNVKITTAADGTLTSGSLADAAKAIRDGSATVPAWGQGSERLAADLLSDLYNLYYRAAILAYIQEKFDDVAKYLDMAGSARPTDGMVAKFDLQKIGLHILEVCSKRKEPSWYPDAINAAKNDSQKLAIKLADTYVHSQRPEKAEAIYKQLLAGDSLLGRPSKAVEGYCLMQLALVYSNQNVNRDKSIEYYKRFLTREYADFPWAADAIMRLTVLEYNTTRDPRRAVAQCQYIISKYPDHPDAERAAYFIALAAIHLGDKSLAESSCKAFIEKYPHSGWKSHVQTVLNNEVPKLQNQEAKEKSQ